MTSLQKPADNQHVAAISTNPEAIAAANSGNGSSRGYRKHRVRAAVHDLAKLYIRSAMGMDGGGRARLEAQPPWQARLVGDGHDRDQM